jgi:hypothetical protein
VKGACGNDRNLVFIRGEGRSGGNERTSFNIAIYRRVSRAGEWML